MHFHYIVACLLFQLSHGLTMITREDARQLKEKVVEIYQETFDNYLKYAFPSDELRPLTCTGRQSFGNYSLTLIDALDGLALIGDRVRFDGALQLLKEHVNFDVDLGVSVFETNIRVLGGLLGAHFMSLKQFNYADPILLEKAIDIGKRLRRAFETETGIPKGYVNLRSGLDPDETPVVCTACATTYSLEFGWLSLVSGDFSFYDTAKKAARETMSTKSQAGLFGSHIDALTRSIMYSESGIAGGIDSMYEYFVKSWMAFGDDEYGQMFQDSYDAVMKHVRSPTGWYTETQANPQNHGSQISSLGAFFPGVQITGGHVAEAIHQMRLYIKLLNRVNFLPEFFDAVNGHYVAGRKQYPLRPEFIESLYYSYLALKQPRILNIAAEMLERIIRHCKTPCGYADIKDVETLEKEDAMQSFFLSETLKYFYLIFAEASGENWNDEWVLTTEAHLLPITRDSIKIGTKRPSQESLKRTVATERKYFNEVLLESYRKQIVLMNQCPVESSSMRPHSVDLSNGGVCSFGDYMLGKSLVLFL